jgi:hypothetical protein
MPNNVPGYNPAFDSIYNSSGFDGQVTSDFLRLGGIPAAQRKDLIDFSTADFDTYKTRFQDYVKSVYPQDYNNFAESDLGQMLTELFAYMGAVMSFKADALAQENYLATAKTNEGVIKLLELIGIEIRGPVSSKATAQLTLPSDPVSGGTTVTIPFADRTVDTVSTRDNLPLSYTLYKVDTNGNIDQTNLQDIVLGRFDFDDDPANLKTDLGSLLLLEGKLQQVEGTFRTGVTQQTIDITLPSVIEGSVVVSGTDGLFTEVENIFFASADAQVFQKKYNDDYSCRLIFGDGEVGKSPTPGTDYKVFFRTGGGLRGNVGSNTLTNSTTVTWDDGTNPTKQLAATFVNVKAGTGGQDAQSIEEARRFGPMWFATQYRAVTGQDYTAYVNKFRSSIGKTGKGMAVLRDNGSAGNMIDLYVLQKASDNQLERASYSFKKELLDYMDTYKMLTDELTVVDGVVRTMDIVGTLYIDRSQQLAADDIKQRVVGKIVDYFSTDTIDFGTPLLLSELVNFIVQDPGARFFSIDNYPNDIYVDFNEIIQLNNIEVNVQFV